MCQQLKLPSKNSFNFEIKMKYSIVLLTLSTLAAHCTKQVQAAQGAGSLKVVYAVNAGGREHTDSNGIHYDADPLQNKVGTASDYGNNLLLIGRVAEQDEILFRTERYHTATFGYDIPIDGDGDYALIMKFCEVYFNEPNKKVFDVMLNKEHTIVSHLDIYQQVGHGTAHEEYVYFAIINGKLYYKDEVSEVRNNAVHLEFIKGTRDNPKINAFALLKGDIEQIPRLTPLAGKEQLDDELGAFEETDKKSASYADEFDDEDEEFANSEAEDTIEDVLGNLRGKDEVIEVEDGIFYQRKVSGPRHPNPYIIDDSAVLLPLFIAIGAFIPMLYCLCKL